MGDKMDDKYIYCPCGSIHCICQDGCFCSPSKGCICLRCKRLKVENFCVNCGKKGGEKLTPLQDFPITGRIRRELEVLYDRIPQSCIKSKAESPASSSSKEYETDDELIFQMDDIDDLQEQSKPKQPAATNIRGLSRTFQPSHNITILNPRQSKLSQISEREIEMDQCTCSQQSFSSNVLRSYEPKTETQQVNITASKSDESQATEAPIAQIVLVNSELNRSKIISTPEESKVTETSITQNIPRSSELNPSIIISTPEESKVTEIPIPQNIPRSSELNPSIIISIPEESKATEIPIAQNIPRSPELNPSMVISMPEDSKTETFITEDLPSSELDQSKISNPGELQTPHNVSGETSSSSNMYSSGSLPSDLTSDIDDSESSHTSATTSPIKIISTSAPSIFDVPEPFRELESPKQETSDVQNPSEESSTSNLSGIETLSISDDHKAIDKTAPLELSVSIETLSTDINVELNKNDDCPPLHFTVSPSALTSTSTETESSEPKTPLIPHSEENFKIQSPEISKHDDDNKRSSSESSSSIEILSAEQTNENIEDEPRKSKSPEKDN